MLIDQISKIYIKTHFKLGESLMVLEWFRIAFVENERNGLGVQKYLDHMEN